MQSFIALLAAFLLLIESQLGLTIPLSMVHKAPMTELARMLPSERVTYVQPSSIKEMVSQLFVIGVASHSLSASEKDFITNYKPGGILLFSRNIDSIEQTKALIQEIKACYPDNYLPPFIAIDQEGGIVNRLPSPYNNSPSPREIGRSYTLEETEKFSSSLGILLAYTGFNVNFAPVMDINSNPNNPIVGSRAFDNDPTQAFNYGYAFYKGLKAQHVLATIKHFPGHGDTSIDSHYGLPTLTKTKDEMLSSDLLPFVKGVEKGIDGIMIGHLLWLDMDDVYPASLSKKIVTDYLRNELAYDGLIFTDDLEMGAVANAYSMSERATLAFEAGNDLLLVVHSLASQTTSIEAIINSMDAQKEEQLKSSIDRITNYKSSYLPYASLKDFKQIEQWFFNRIK